MTITKTITETKEVTIELPAFFKKGITFYVVLSEDESFEIVQYPTINYVGIGKDVSKTLWQDAEQISAQEFDEYFNEVKSKVEALLSDITYQLSAIKINP